MHFYVFFLKKQGLLREYKNNIISEIDEYESKMILMNNEPKKAQLSTENNTLPNEKYTEEEERLIPIKLPSNNTVK